MTFPGAVAFAPRRERDEECHVHVAAKAGARDIARMESARDGVAAAGTIYMRLRRRVRHSAVAAKVQLKRKSTIRQAQVPEHWRHRGLAAPITHHAVRLELFVAGSPRIARSTRQRPYRDDVRGHLTAPGAVNRPTSVRLPRGQLSPLVKSNVPRSSSTRRANSAEKTARERRNTKGGVLLNPRTPPDLRPLPASATPSPHHDATVKNPRA